MPDPKLKCGGLQMSMFCEVADVLVSVRKPYTSHTYTGHDVLMNYVGSWLQKALHPDTPTEHEGKTYFD